MNAQVVPHANGYVASLFTADVTPRVNEYWPLIRNWLEKFNASMDESLVIYTLATIRAETWPVFSPNPENPSTFTRLKHDGQLRQFGKYDVAGTNAQRQLGNRPAPGAREQMLRAQHGDAPLKDDNDGFNFRGRGFVQLTGRWNYTHMQNKLVHLIPGLDLVNHPDQAADPEIAAHIIAIWVCRWKKAQISNAMKLKHYVAARKAVNKQALNMQAFMSLIDAHERKKEQLLRFLESPIQHIA
jgi:hypothetical protein